MFSGLQLGAYLKGRMATQRSKKGSEKVLGKVLGKCSQKGSEKGMLWVYSSEGVLRRAFVEGA